MSILPRIKAREYCLTSGLFDSEAEFNELLPSSAGPYLQDSVIREAKQNKSCSLQWAKKPYKTLALLIYITGVESKTLCHLCQQKNSGYFSKCIFSHYEGKSSYYSACANCIYTGHANRCSLSPIGAANSSSANASANINSSANSADARSYIEDDSDERQDQADGGTNTYNDRHDHGPGDRERAAFTERKYAHRSRSGMFRPAGLSSAASVPNMKRSSGAAGPSLSRGRGGGVSKNLLQPNEIGVPPRLTSSKSNSNLELEEAPRPRQSRRSQQHQQQEQPHPQHPGPDGDPVHLVDDLRIYLDQYRRYYENMGPDQLAREKTLRNLEISVIDAIEVSRKAKRRRLQ
ncbi:uncharacterized protein MKZ38_000770 [Zalerion maritima]|uniref:Uncharacterized protein n=1 Tax=Zalerion maritima TaxID=339359 RepID=A0AAD5RF18_9PEZI|nr:uncharacterized protein MKZ38_000770 [Zalerion maritima]